MGVVIKYKWETHEAAALALTPRRTACPPGKACLVRAGVTALHGAWVLRPRLVPRGLLLMLLTCAFPRTFSAPA